MNEVFEKLSEVFEELRSEAGEPGVFHTDRGNKES